MCIYIGTASLSYTLTVLILFLLIIIIIIILLLLLPSLLVSQFILTWCNEPHGYSCINYVSIIDKTIDWLIYEHQIWVCKLFTPIETNSVYPKIVYSDISSSADCEKKMVLAHCFKQTFSSTSRGLVSADLLSVFQTTQSRTGQVQLQH